MTDRQAIVPVATVWTSPERVRDTDSPAAQAVSDVDGWIAGLGPEQRVDLQGRTETQLLLGEQVRVLDSADGWSRVVVPGQSSTKEPAGYPGWVPSAQLGTVAEADGEPVVVRVPRASSYASADSVEPAGWLSLGTTLRVVAERSGRLELAAPEPLWVAAADVQRVGVPSATTVDALDVAALLLGVPYAWGGASAAQIDCSGLVMLAHRVLGRPVPRDAHDQLAAVEEVPLADRQRGDIVFFARDGQPAHHVGFDAGDGLLLHANMGAGRGVVERVPIPAARRATLVAAGRFLPARV